MKVIKKISVFLMAMMLYIGLYSVPVYGAFLSQDGLEVNLTADKETYDSEESVLVTFTVKNTNDFAMKNVALETLIPQGYEIVKTENATVKVETLEAGETITLQITFMPESEDKEVSVQPTPPDNLKSPATGENIELCLCLTLIVLPTIGLVIVVRGNKSKSWKRMLSLMLCMAMLASMFAGVPVYANEEKLEIKTISITENVQVGNETLKLQSNVTYQVPNATKYTVTFCSNGGSVIETQIIQEGMTAIEPEIPIMQDYIFAGWYIDKELTDLYNFANPVTSDIVLYAKWVLQSDLNIVITNSDYRAETQSIITKNDIIDLTGKVTGVGEVKEIKVVYNGYGKDETSVDVNGTDVWFCQIPLEIGTNEIKIFAYATDDTMVQTVVYVNRTSETIEYSDNVKVADIQDFETIYNDIIGCWTDDNGTELASDDTIVMLVDDDALLLEQIDDELLKSGEIYMIPDNELFVVGFSGIYKSHRAPIGCEDYPAESYPDSEYEEIVFEYAGFGDLFGDDVSLDFSNGVDMDNPIAFAMAGDGTPMRLNNGTSMLALENEATTYSNLYYGEPGWQVDELVSSIEPDLSFVVDEDGIDLQLKWKDIVIYDDDGKKNPESGIEADKGQLKLSGEFGITDLWYTGGIEWHPSLVPWNIELLPQQIISKLKYTYGGELTLKGGVTASTSDLTKKITKYKNSKEFWGMKVNGVKTFDTKLMLGIIGVNLAPVAVKPYKTLRGLASASTTTTPKLFLYLFLDIDGNVTLEGSLNLKYSTDVVKGYNIQKNGYIGSYGSQEQNKSDKHYEVGSTHTLDVYDTNDNNGGLTLKISGKAETGLDFGGGIGAGLMICGVCPATIDGEVFYRASGITEGEIQFLPWNPENILDGYVGVYHGIGAQANIEARVMLEKKDVGQVGLNVNKNFEHMWWEDSMSTSKFEGTVYVADDDEDNTNNSVISDASVKLTKKDTHKVWTTTTNANGKYKIGSMPDGEYTMLVEKEGYDSYTNDNVIFSKEKKLDVFLNEQNPWDGNCTLSGKIVIADTDTDMSNNPVLAGALVELRNNSNNAMISTITAENGTYEINNIPAGTYTITISKEGYISIFAAVSIADNIENYYNATLEAISEAYNGEGIASGTIYDALNGYTVKGVTLNIRDGIGTSSGTIVQTVKTNSEGEYVTPYMQAGNYTVEVVDNRELDNEEARYITSTFTIKILGNQSIPNQDGYVTNGLKPEQLRIVLRWGTSPSDLDSHLVGATTSNGRFHTYYSQKEHYESELMVNLDLDDTDGEGPETTTIYKMTPGIYTFMVHDYTNRYTSNSTNMANSGAYVEIYQGESNVATYRFNVPNSEGTLWTVFSYNSNTGEITPINTMDYEEYPNYVGSSVPVSEMATLINEIFIGKPEVELKDYELKMQNVVETEN